MPDIFVSYMRQDGAWVGVLTAALERAGFSVWPEAGAAFGDSSGEQGERAFASSACVIIVWSEAALAFEPVLGQARRARERGILVSVLKDGCSPPRSVIAAPAFDLSKWSPDSCEEFELLVEDLHRSLRNSAPDRHRPGIVPPTAKRQATPHDYEPTVYQPRELRVGEVIAHYQIVRTLGEGGSGAIYEARNIHNEDERVAIKFIQPDIEGREQFFGLLKSEANALQRVKNDAVVQYRTFGRIPDSDEYFLVIEYVEGPTLGALLRSKPLAPSDVRRLAIRLSEGLQAAHDEGVIHRDLSPDNVVLPDSDPASATLIDFGIARNGAFDPFGTSFAGKLSFAAPEQFTNGPGQVGPWTDLYSLGLLLAAAALGRKLEMGTDIASAILSRKSVPELEDLPDELRGPIAALLQPDPEYRVRSAAAAHALFLEAPFPRQGSKSLELLQDTSEGSAFAATSQPSNLDMNSTSDAATSFDLTRQKEEEIAGPVAPYDSTTIPPTFVSQAVEAPVASKASPLTNCQTSLSDSVATPDLAKVGPIQRLPGSVPPTSVEHTLPKRTDARRPESSSPGNAWRGFLIGVSMVTALTLAAAFWLDSINPVLSPSSESKTSAERDLPEVDPSLVKTIAGARESAKAAREAGDRAVAAALKSDEVIKTAVGYIEGAEDAAINARREAKEACRRSPSAGYVCSLKLTDGSTYDGQAHCTQSGNSRAQCSPAGFGVSTKKREVQYFGGWADTSPNLGCSAHADGRSYCGQWTGDGVNGYSRLALANGETRTGRFVAGALGGFGIIDVSAVSDERRTHYKGQLAENGASGSGILALRDGSEYLGDWQANSASGYMIFKGINGFQVAAKVKADNFEIGEITYSDGRVYQGELEDSGPTVRRAGLGVLYSRSGAIEAQGRWQEDRLAEEFLAARPQP